MSNNSIDLATGCISLADTIGKLIAAGMTIEEIKDVIKSAEKELRGAGNEIFRLNKIIQILSEEKK